MVATARTDNPFTGEIVFEAPLSGEAELDRAIRRAHAAHLEWRRVPIRERIQLVERFCEAFGKERDRYAAEITASMGKPLRQAHNEVNGMIDRARQMAGIAEVSLAPEVLPPKEGFERSIVREPVGVVAVLAAWNYPLLIGINPTVAAILAGNAVVMKHSSRTPRCAEHLEEAFRRAGAPDGLFVAIHTDHRVAEKLVQHELVGFVSFTGSVGGGRRIYQAIAEKRFIDVALELGGKDPAYVAADAPFDFTVENVMDGALYNTGQSCCAVERIYVEAPLYDRFLEAAVDFARKQKIGDPMAEGTTIGPMAQPNAPDFLLGQVEQARALGARVLTGGKKTSAGGKGRFFEPTVCADTDARMAIETEESFGPVVAIAKVAGDDDAVERMNASSLGLTASIWTKDIERGRRIAARTEAGTVYLNRCDFLDPLLAWTGWKDSGRGASLSRLGFLSVTKPKSLHFRTKV
jgi:acyl-CoA reductase-like NAD-dependent aldehyde dehydrogenase